MMEMIVKDIFITESPQESFTNLSTKAYKLQVWCGARAWERRGVRVEARDRLSEKEERGVSWGEAHLRGQI